MNRFYVGNIILWVYDTLLSIPIISVMLAVV